MFSDYQATGAIIGAVLFILALFHMLVHDEPFGVQNPNSQTTIKQLAGVSIAAVACVQLWPALFVFGVGSAIVLPVRNKSNWN